MQWKGKERGERERERERLTSKEMGFSIEQESNDLVLFFLPGWLLLQMKQEIECGRYQHHHHRHNSIFISIFNPKTKQNMRF